MLYLFFEASSLASLFFLEKTRSVTYSPIPTGSLSETQKASILSFINDSTKYLKYSSALGWTIKRNGRVDKYESNSQGIRASRDYPLIPPEGIVRISSFGDSFTHCDDVSNKNTWQARMEEADGVLEVLNFGVPAYGLDQAFLRYHQEGIRYNPHIVFIGFMSENINRHVNVFRPFYLPSPYWPLTKPRFTVKDDKLFLLKNPMREPSRYYDLLDRPEVALPRLGENDYHFSSPSRYKEGAFDFLPSVRLIKIATAAYMQSGNEESAIIVDGRYNEDSEAYKVTVKIFDEFVELAMKNNTLPIIVLFPNHEDIVRYHEENTNIYGALEEHFAGKEYRYIDLMRAFDTQDGEGEIEDHLAPLFLWHPFFRKPVHYSARGNRVVAEHILDYLQKEGLTEPGSIERELNMMKARGPTGKPQ